MNFDVSLNSWLKTLSLSLNESTIIGYFTSTLSLVHVLVLCYPKSNMIG